MTTRNFRDLNGYLWINYQTYQFENEYLAGWTEHQATSDHVVTSVQHHRRRPIFLIEFYEYTYFIQVEKFDFVSIEL